MSEDRISRLSKRFKTHAVGRPPTSERARERRSFYLDGGLVDKLDEVYRKLSHDVYPKEVNKSEFLEAMLEYGLNHMDEIKAELSDSP